MIKGGIGHNESNKKGIVCSGGLTSLGNILEAIIDKTIDTKIKEGIFTLSSL